MSDFDKYFTLYESTDPPPVITDGYKKVFNTYKQYINPIWKYDLTEDTNSTEDFDSEDENKFYDFIEIGEQKPQSTMINFDKIDQNKIDSHGNYVDTSNVNKQAQNIIKLARQFVGTKYQWGGMTPSTGFDCSGLIQYVYKQNGINLPRTVRELENVGTEVDNLADVQVGDLICTPGTGKSGKHIKIVSQIKDGQIYTIEAKGKKYGIVEDKLMLPANITTIRRVLNQKSNNVIIDYFLNKGLTINQAKGIYGNLMQESSGKINAISNDGNNSYGLAQWTGPRKEKLFEMYGSNPTFMQQLDFLWWELNNTHKSALKALKNTTSIYDATKVFMDQFERPNKNYANFNKRLKYANSI